MTFVEDSQREPLSSTFSMPQSHVSEHESIYLHCTSRTDPEFDMDWIQPCIGLDWFRWMTAIRFH